MRIFAPSSTLVAQRSRRWHGSSSHGAARSELLELNRPLIDAIQDALGLLEREPLVGHALRGRPASAYSEMLVAFARAHRPEEARRAITAMGITILSLTDAIAERAAALRARHSRLRLPEAIVLATAQEMGGSLLSYDRKLSRLAGKLT